MKSPRAVRVVLILLAVVVFAGMVRVGYVLLIRRAIVAELQPVVLKNCTLTRVGSANDGGYLMCDRMPEQIDAAYSYGIGKNDDWGCEVSRTYGVPVHQYDCFNPARPTCEGGNFVFHNECVGDRAEHIDSRVFDTFENQLRRNGDSGRRLLVKIDIEAAEWDVILATPDAVLASIPQLAMELHGHNERKVLEAIRKLKQHFHLVNLNFNNWDCSLKFWPMKTWAYQVLFVNKNIGVVDASAPVPAPRSPLNAPDAPMLPNCQFAP
jgi:hypothetical protein